MEKVYRYIDGRFVEFNSVRCTEQDAIFHYTNEKIVNGAKRQVLYDGYVDSEGKFYYTGKGAVEIYDLYYKPIVKYGGRIKHISVTDIYGSAPTYILSEDGKVVYIEVKDGYTEGKLVDVDLSGLSDGEMITYISGNVALSDGGNVYYINECRLTRDETLSDIVTLRSGNGILVAVNTDGRIVVKQPYGWRIPLSITGLEQVASIEMYTTDDSAAGYIYILKADGSVVVVNRNGEEVKTELPKDKRFVTVSCGSIDMGRYSVYRMVALTAEGEVYVCNVNL